ncbi:MAG: hypothetical protein J6N54_08910 [Bacteroidales bacterium]|nr:hypothetical protein [Bacteroidales bacterium]
MKIYNFYFENNLPSRSIVTTDFIKAYSVLTEEERHSIKSMYTGDVEVVD